MNRVHLSLPYSKLTIFQTTTVNTYDILLFEDHVTTAAGSRQMIKPSYPKIIYIVNIGPGNLFITNASITWTIDNNATYPIDNEGTGITITPGQCRSFMNINYSLQGYSQIYGLSLSTSNWVLVS